MNQRHDPGSVEEYLDRFAAPLRKSIPTNDLAAIRDEIGQHLTTLVNEEVLDGKSDSEAVKSAIARFGDPAVVGKRVLKAFRQAGQARLPLWFHYARVAAATGILLLTTMFAVYATTIPWHGNLLHAAIAGIGLGTISGLATMAVTLWGVRSCHSIRDAVGTKQASLVDQIRMNPDKFKAMYSSHAYSLGLPSSSFLLAMFRVARPSFVKRYSSLIAAPFMIPSLIIVFDSFIRPHMGANVPMSRTVFESLYYCFLLVPVSVYLLRIMLSIEVARNAAIIRLRSF